MNRHKFSQPLLNERKTCGWNSSTSLCGVEVCRTEYVRVAPDDVTTHRRHVFDVYNQYARDLEKGQAAMIALSSVMSWGANKFRKIAKLKVGMASTKGKREVYNSSTIITAIDTQRSVLTIEAQAQFDRLWGYVSMIRCGSARF
jgi:hypothetical protein